MRRTLGWSTLAVMVVLAACAPRPNGGDEVSEEGLLASVQATSTGDSVQFVLQVTNTTGSPVELVYPTGQSFDFVVRDEGGAEVWRWSADRMFTQAIREESIGVEETITHSVVWPVAGQPGGRYTVAGMLTVMDRTVEQRTEFTIR